MKEKYDSYGNAEIEETSDQFPTETTSRKRNAKEMRTRKNNREDSDDIEEATTARVNRKQSRPVSEGTQNPIPRVVIHNDEQENTIQVTGRKRSASVAPKPKVSISEIQNNQSGFNLELTAARSRKSPAPEKVSRDSSRLSMGSSIGSPGEKRKSQRPEPQKPDEKRISVIPFPTSNASTSPVLIEVPVVIKNERPGASKHRKSKSNFDKYSPTVDISVIVVDTTVSNPAPASFAPIPAGRVRRMSSMLPQGAAVDLEALELMVKQPKLIQAPLDTNNMLKVVAAGAGNSHPSFLSSALLDSPLSENGQSPLKAHNVREAGKARKKVNAMQQKDGKPLKCQNFTWLLLYLSLTCLVLLITMMASNLGEIGRLVLPYDSTGKQCGTEISGRPVLFYFDMTKSNGFKRCVSKCPTEIVSICKYNTTLSRANFTERVAQIENGTCVWNTVPTVSVLYRCIPRNIAETNFLNAQQVAASHALVSDIKSDSFMCVFFNILISCIVSLVSCIVGSIISSALWYYWLLFFGSALLYLSIFVIFFSLWGVTGYAGLQYYTVMQIKNSYGLAASTFSSDPAVILAALVVGFILSSLFSIAVYRSQSSVSLALKIISEAAKHLLNVKYVVFLTIFQSIAALVVCGYAILVTGLLYTMHPLDLDAYGTALNQITSSFIGGSLPGFYFATVSLWLIWTLDILYALGRISVARAVSRVYWTGTTSVKSKISIFQTTKEILEKNFGSMALGSIAIPFAFALGIIEYSLRPSFAKAKNVIENTIKTKDSKIDKTRAWFKHVLLDVNHMAFIQLAVGGGDFCASSIVASDVFQQNLRGIIKMGRIITWICVLSIGLGTSVLGLILTNSTISSLSTALPIILVILLGALYIATLFLQCFAIAIDTILYCYCEDLDRNDGSAMMPFAMPASLQEFIIKHRKECEDYDIFSVPRR